jgi:hypothetical protein
MEQNGTTSGQDRCHRAGPRKPLKEGFDMQVNGFYSRQARREERKFLRPGRLAHGYLRRAAPAGGIEVAAAALKNGLSGIDSARRPIEAIARAVEVETGGRS